MPVHKKNACRIFLKYQKTSDLQGSACRISKPSIRIEMEKIEKSSRRDERKNIRGKW
jgi:hypothetical protein